MKTLKKKLKKICKKSNPNYELERPLPKRKNKKIIGLIKDELGVKVIKQSPKWGFNNWMPPYELC